jgi:hypothetical protein
MCIFDVSKKEIMIHLEKQTSTIVQSIQLNRLACVNNPFIKGAILKLEEFKNRASANPDICCKKCLSILSKIN